MPSIEIVCVEQVEPTPFTDLPFAVTASAVLASHRSPRALFEEEFGRLDGCMYHLGNPHCLDPDYGGPFFAYELIRHDQEVLGALRFQSDYVDELRGLLERLVKCSPVGRLFFTTDWQFGPEERTEGGEVVLPEFWHMHDSGALRLNGAYTLTR